METNPLYLKAKTLAKRNEDNLIDINNKLAELEEVCVCMYVCMYMCVCMCMVCINMLFFKKAWK